MTEPSSQIIEASNPAQAAPVDYRCQAQVGKE